MIYDIIFIGAGPASLMAAKELLEKGLSVLIVEKGKDVNRRKDPICGWFGSGVSRVNRLEFEDPLFKVHEIKDSINYLKKISIQKISKKNKYCNLSYETGKEMAKHFHDLLKDVEVLFDNEVISIVKDGNYFRIETEKKEVIGKKCIIGTGKYSIEWIKNISGALGLKNSNKKAKMGIRVEVPTSKIKNYIAEQGDIFVKEGNLFCEDVRINSTIGEWTDSEILSSFGYASIENSRKTNFMIGIEDDVEACIRNVKIVNVLNNDKIKKEYMKEFLSSKSILYNLDAFNSLRAMIDKLECIIPGITDYATVYIPEIRLNGILNVDNNMMTSLFGLYGIGECTDKVSNLIGAMASGIIVAKNLLKENR